MMGNQLKQVALSALAAATFICAPASMAVSDTASSSRVHSAPTFQLSGAGNSSIKLEDFKGQVVLLNFWASWCGPCRQEMPILDRIHQRYSASGFSVVGVNVDAERSEAEALLADSPVNFPVAFDPESQVSHLYEVDSMPSTVMIDRQGNVRYLHRGYQPGFEEAYIQQIKELIRE